MKLLLEFLFNEAIAAAAGGGGGGLECLFGLLPFLECRFNDAIAAAAGGGGGGIERFFGLLTLEHSCSAGGDGGDTVGFGGREGVIDLFVFLTKKNHLYKENLNNVYVE